MLKHALPPETVKSDVKGDHAHWKALVCFLETNLKAWGMEHHLEPTATPEEFNTHHENCKIVLRDCVSHHFKRKSAKTALEGTVSTQAKVMSWGQINECGTASDKQRMVPSLPETKRE